MRAGYAMKRKTFDGEDGIYTTTDPSSSEAMDDDPVLESKHKIFLSHSGAQKEFVEHLCKALEERCHHPFFDRHPDSLPKGKKFPGLIFEAIKQCQVLVVVISEEYFMSKWPMIELNAFVEAMKEMKSSMNRDILPLFYGLSVSELKDEKRRQRWFEAWETFAKEDLKQLIKVDDWKHALHELTKFSGLLYDRDLKQVVEYENAIVSRICKLVTPDIKWEDSHVQGNAHEVVIEKMKQVGASQFNKACQVKVVGLYGVGGMGKTTVCKTLCNELSNAFEGRVCHIEFDNTASNSKELLQKVLIKLTRKSRELVQQLEEGECKDVLYKSLKKEKTFLAIDNVWDNTKSIKQALVLLQAPSHPDSLVLVTTRVQRTLKLLGLDGGAYLEMPELGRGDASKLFLHHASKGQQFTSEEDMSFVKVCVERCHFSKGNGGGFHYHPLALEALGRQLGCHGKNPSEWLKMLPSLWNFNAFSGENEVFDVLRISFDLLQPLEQALFMDVGVFFEDEPSPNYYSERVAFGQLELLCTLYKQEKVQMQSLLNGLKGKGLLQDANLSLRRPKLQLHELYREFLLLEAKGILGDGGNIPKLQVTRRWMCMDVCDGNISELQFTPTRGCWQDLTRLCLKEDESTTCPLESLEGIEWCYFPNVLVLQLDGLKRVKGTLNLKDMKCLRSLHIHGLWCIERLEGLGGLTNLTFLEWTNMRLCGSPELEVVGGQLPKSLNYLYICVHRLLYGLDVFARCNNLRKLILEFVEVGVQLCLKNCSSMEHVKLLWIKNLQTLVLPSTRMAPSLQSLEVSQCRRLVDIQGLSDLVSLEHLELGFEALKGVPTFLTLTKLQTLKTHGGRDSSELHIPCQLQELHHRFYRGSMMGPSNLNGFNQLKVLDLSWSYNLTYISKMGDLPALQTLRLTCCSLLQRLPDLSKSRNLEELDLDHCYALELHEEDIQMLATLPSLHPVHFSYHYSGETWLDLSRQKVLQYTVAGVIPPKSLLHWMEGEWEEKELGPPPIKLQRSWLRRQKSDSKDDEFNPEDVGRC